MTCSSCLHNQQDLCWGNTSRNTSEEPQEPQKLNSPGPVDFPLGRKAKIMFNKFRDFIVVVTLTKMGSAREASHHLTWMENCQTFHLHAFVLCKSP